MKRTLKISARAVVALTGAIAMVATVSSCGDEQESGPEREAMAALAQIQTDFDAGDVAAVCARVVAQPRCREVVTFLHDDATPSRSAVRSRDRSPLGARVAGRRATVRVAVGERIDGTVRMVRRGGEWKLVGVRMRPDLSRWRWRVRPPALDPSPPPATPVDCPPIAAVAHRGRRTVSGGCAVRFDDPDMRIVMLTAFGDFTVARCGLGFTLHLAPDAVDVLADEIDFVGADLCSGIGPCADDEDGIRYPWQGDALRGPLGAGMRLRLAICVGTPLGDAHGMWHYRLTRDDGRVVARAYDYPIGTSSLQFLGTWSSDDFEPPPGG